MADRGPIQKLQQDQAIPHEAKTDTYEVKCLLEWLSLSQVYFKNHEFSEAGECCDNALSCYARVPDEIRQLPETKDLKYTVIGLKVLCEGYQNDPQKRTDATALLFKTVLEDPGRAGGNPLIQKANRLLLTK